jgi:hypothetical protein
MNDIFHDRFQCFVQRLEYDFCDAHRRVGYG